MVAVEQAKIELIRNRLIYVGFAMLDLSKMLMYDFHYNYIKPKYPDSMLQFTNTDSVTYQIENDRVNDDFYVNKHLFYFSGYGTEIPFYNDENNKVIGKIKDELNKDLKEKIVGLRVKIYSLKTKK